MFLGGSAPSIGMIGGGELGGEGIRTGVTRTELSGGKGNSRGFRKKAIGLEGTKVSLSSKSVTLTRGGVLKPGVEKSSEVLGLNHSTTSGEIGVTILSPSNPRPGEDKSTGTLPNFKLQETPTTGITGECEADIGVSVGG
jgi:hypothetical protein